MTVTHKRDMQTHNINKDQTIKFCWSSFSTGLVLRGSPCGDHVCCLPADFLHLPMWGGPHKEYGV